MKNFLRNKVSLGVFLFFLFFGFGNIFYGEKTQVRAGFFYDGSVYADITKHFEELVFHKGAGADPFKHDSDQFKHGINDYLLQRALPLGLVHYSIRAIGAEFSNENIIRGFEYWNLVYLLISILTWHFILQKRSLNSMLQLLSYVLIFGNFAFLKLNFYYPVLTDTPAFMLMMLTLWAWLNHKPIFQTILLLCGAFTWPSFFYLSGVLLFFMPNKNDDLYDENSKIKFWATPVAALLFVGFSIWVFYLKHHIDGAMAYFEGEWGAEKLNRTLLPLSIVLMLTYLMLACYNLFKLSAAKLFDIRRYLKSFHVITGVVLLLLFIAIKIVLHELKGADTVLGIKLYFRNTFLRSCTDPLTFLVSNIQYFGILFILWLLYFKSTLRQVQSHGPGAVIIMAMILIFSINSESRQITYIIPILCYFLMPKIGALNLSKMQVLALLGCNLLLSKAWLPLNHGENRDILTAFPDQWYFMNMGPWMSHSSYWIFAATAGVVFCFVWILLKPNKSKTVNN